METGLKANYKLLSLLGFLAMLSILFWVWKSTYPLETTLFTKPQNSQRSDFMLENFTSRQFDQSGQLHYELNAKQLMHYPHNRSALLEQPHVTFYNDRQAPWVAVSRSGLIQEADESLILSGQVTIRQDLSNADDAYHTSRGGPWLIESEQFTLYPKRNVITSDKRVTVASRNMQMQSMGMHANTLYHTIILTDQVRGHHTSR